MVQVNCCKQMNEVQRKTPVLHIRFDWGIGNKGRHKQDKQYGIYKGETL